MPLVSATIAVSFGISTVSPSYKTGKHVNAQSSSTVNVVVQSCKETGAFPRWYPSG